MQMENYLCNSFLARKNGLGDQIMCLCASSTVRIINVRTPFICKRVRIFDNSDIFDRCKNMYWCPIKTVLKQKLDSFAFVVFQGFFSLSNETQTQRSVYTKNNRTPCQTTKACFFFNYYFHKHFSQSTLAGIICFRRNDMVASSRVKQ